MTHRFVSTSLASSGTSAASGATHCERPGTPRLTTVRRLSLAIALGATLGACGGGNKATKHSDTYVAATDVQEKCCENLGGGARDSCLQSIVRVPDASVARSQQNQETYACVQEHFVCDPTTGMPTQQSAQEQLDCIQDLGQ
jgi:hypothetical protein